MEMSEYMRNWLKFERPNWLAIILLMNFLALLLKGILHAYILLPSLRYSKHIINNNADENLLDDRFSSFINRKI
jgi:hypothetical protein